MAEETAQPRGVSFHDYNRTIVGYHGTTADVADRLVNGDPFSASDNDDDWFGKGIYFWEYAPKQAWWWSTKFKKKKFPAVVRSYHTSGSLPRFTRPIERCDIAAISR